MAKKGYWVVCYVGATDRSVLPAYRDLAGPAIAAFGGRVVAIAAPAKVYEAGVNDTTVLVEFDSLEKAVATYESDAYKAALKAMDNKVKRDFRIVEGV